MGIVVFCPEGRDPLPEELVQGEPDSHVVKKMEERSLPEKFRAIGFKVDTGKRKEEEIKHEEKEAAMLIVQQYHNTVFLPGIGCIKTKPIEFNFEDGFSPIQPPRRGVPYHYQSQLSKHLSMMRQEGAIEDVNPREAVDCVMNVVITDKKEAGQIRMNVDATPINKGIKMTKYHVQTAAEVRHALDGAKVFSD